MKEFGINPDKGLIVAGETSGADMALVVAHLCRDSYMSPPLTGVYAAMPAGATRETIPQKYQESFLSMEQNSHAPLLHTETLDFIRSKISDLIANLFYP